MTQEEPLDGPSAETGAGRHTSGGIFGQEDVVLIGVRDHADADRDPARAGLMCAIPGFEADSVILEQRDGDSLLRLRSGEVEITRAGEKRPAFKARDIGYEVLVTDARITFACSKYTKGGTWVGLGGGAVMALALNAGGRARAAQRRRGNMMVGHVRYPWLSGVFAWDYKNFAQPGLIRLVVRLPGEKVKTYFDIEWPKAADTSEVAAEIVRRAAKFRLAHDPELTGDNRAELLTGSRLSELPRESADGAVAGWSFSRFWPVSARSARFGL